MQRILGRLSWLTGRHWAGRGRAIIRALEALTMLPLVLTTAVAGAGGKDEQVLRELGPDKKIAVCAFELYNPDVDPETGSGVWVSYRDGDITSISDDSPYQEEVAREMLQIFERAFAATGAFELVPSDRLASTRRSQELEREKVKILERSITGTGVLNLDASDRLAIATSSRALTIPELTRENGLFACVHAQSYVAAGFGWKKKVKLITKWHLIGASGWQVDLDTDCASEERQGVWFNLNERRLKPVFLQLAQHSAQELLRQLAERMRTAGSTAEVRIADPDEVGAATLFDTGALPQPEPGCVKNSDGKWEKRVALPAGVDLALVFVPDGSFEMGSEEGKPDEDWQPRHTVRIDRAFWIGKYELTQAQWMAVMGTNPSHFKGESLPVDSVSWNDAVKLVTTLNQRLGLGPATGFRLPSEAEWEYACRASTTTTYSFSNSRQKLAQYAWYEENALKTTHPVGQLSPNPWGTYDMYGNVAEWCEDTWNPGYSGAPTDGSAWGGVDEERVQRGGHWDRSSKDLRSFSRDSEEAEDGSRTGGLRLVMGARNPHSERAAPVAPASAAWPSEVTQSETTTFLSPASAERAPAAPPVAQGAPADAIGTAPSAMAGVGSTVSSPGATSQPSPAASVDEAGWYVAKTTTTGYLVDSLAMLGCITGCDVEAFVKARAGRRCLTPECQAAGYSFYYRGLRVASVSNGLPTVNLSARVLPFTSDSNAIIVKYLQIPENKTTAKVTIVTRGDHLELIGVESIENVNW